MKNNIIVLLLWTIFYFSASIVNLNYIDTNSDELWPGISATKMIEGCDTNYCGDEIHLFGKKLPLNMQEPYLFALPNYMYVPVFLLFGINIWSLRILPIVLSYLTILMVYYIIKYYFNEKTALITALLLGTDFRFIHFGRIGSFLFEPYVSFFFYLAIVLYIYNLKNKEKLYLYLASFALGLGLSVKISVIARYSGIIGANIILFPKSVLALRKKYSIRQWVLLISCFALGASLFISYNILEKGDSFKLISFIYNGKTTSLGTNNSNVLQNMKTRIHQYNNIIGGFDKEWGIPESDKYNCKPVVLSFYFALFVNLIIYIFKKVKRLEFKRILFVYIYFIIVFIASLFSPTTFRSYHLIIMYPFAHFVIAVLINNVSNIFEGYGKMNIAKIASKILACSLIIMLLATNTRAVYMYYSDFKSGREYFGNTYFYMEELSEYLKNHDLKPLCCFGSELIFKTIYFSKGRVNNMEMVGWNDTIDEDKLNNLLKSYKKIYLLKPESYVSYNALSYDLLMNYVMKTRRKTTIVKEIKNSKNILLYTIYEISE
ncbi:MAG: glycosyltransferase family 39 protein [Elusimicrobia bacterium]|nr:glycosyltransferase family 39 protein [Candidatus Liberimonas magnetica]